MKNFLLLFLFLFATCLLSAQIRPPVFPEDVDAATLNSETGGIELGVNRKSKRKGVSISYSYVNGGDLRDEDGIIQPPLTDLDALSRVAIKIKAPIINKDNFKLLAGCRYVGKTYNFASFGADFQDVFVGIDNKLMKTSGFEIIGLKKMKSNSSLTVRATIEGKGDYDGIANFDSQYAIYSLQGVYTKQKNESYEWGVGLIFTKSFRRSIVLPFFVFNKNFNDKWGLEVVLPAFFSLRRNISENTILLFGPKYNSSSYAFDVVSPLDEVLSYNLNHSEVRLSLALQQKVYGWIWLDAEVGYQGNFSTDFESDFDFAANFKVEPTDSPYFKIGLFLTPPSNFSVKKK
ncbi:MAG: hypothetical protein ACI85O_000624 [Saprospiraceae bacterium]|jgi:hypothetical protein